MLLSGNIVKKMSCVCVFKKHGGLLLRVIKGLTEVIKYLSTIVHVVLEGVWLFYYTPR